MQGIRTELNQRRCLDMTADALDEHCDTRTGCGRIGFLLLAFGSGVIGP
jgi:hypothetical protein